MAKLIGGAVGCVGIGSCIMLSAYFFTSPRYRDMPLFVGFWILNIVSGALVALSHFYGVVAPGHSALS